MNIVIAYLDEIDVIRDGNWSLLMSALGLGRVETPGQNGRFDGRDDRTLCPDRRHERLDAHDVHYSGEIVGQYVQCHL